MSQVAELNPLRSVALTAVRLQDRVEEHLDSYFLEMGNSVPADFYNVVLHQVEKPLLEVVLQQTRYNQSRAAGILGLSRGTLRKKMKTHGLLRSDLF